MTEAAAVLFLAALAAAYLAGAGAGWAAGVSSAVLFLGACWVAVRGRGRASFILTAGGAFAVYEGAAHQARWSSLLDVSARPELLFWAAFAFALLAAASFWERVGRWRAALWLIASGGLIASEYAFALPAGRSFAAVLSEGPRDAFGALRWAALLPVVASLIRIKGEEIFLLRAASFPLLIGGAFMAFGAGALQTPLPPPVPKPAPLASLTPLPLPAPPPPPPPPVPAAPKKPKRLPTGSRHVMVLEVKDEEDDPPLPVSPPRAKPAPQQPRPEPPPAEPVADPVADRWNQSVIAAETRYRLKAPLKPLLEPAGYWRGALAAGLLIYLFALGCFWDSLRREKKDG